MKIVSLIFLLINLLHVDSILVKDKKPRAGIDKEVFGKMPDGREAHLFTLRNASGMEIKISNYGGYIVSWSATDKKGKQENIVLGVPTFADYLKGTPVFGPIIGRYANRITKGKVELDGQEFTLTTNSGGNHIHGGKTGFDKKLWIANTVSGINPTLKLHYTSPDGEEGYPGTLDVDVQYTLQKDNALRIDYSATTTKTTIVNLTNHTYFNLSGMKRDVLNHLLEVKAATYLPVGPNQIPTGEFRSVANTPFDFRKATAVGARINDSTEIQLKYSSGYDHTWVFSDTSSKLKLGATVYEPVSGRFMEMYTTEPGVQIYTANHLNGSLRGKEGVPFTKRFGLCLETQHFPDSPNQPTFPSTTLRPGETYMSTTIYKLSVR